MFLHSEFVFHVAAIDPIVQDDYKHNFLKNELNFVLQHSKIDRDARLETNENMKETIISLHSLLKILGMLVNSHLQLPNS